MLCVVGDRGSSCVYRVCSYLAKLAEIVDRVGVELCQALDASLPQPLLSALDDFLVLALMCLSSADVAVGEVVVGFVGEFVFRLRKMPNMLASRTEQARVLLRLTATQLRYPNQYGVRGVQSHCMCLDTITKIPTRPSRDSTRIAPRLAPCCATRAV
jgi:hypothetical protein